MASVKVVFRKDKINKKGKGPIHIRITQTRKSRYIPIGISITENEWNDGTSQVRKSHKNSARYNAYIAKKVAEAEEAVIHLSEKKERPSAAKIRQQILGPDPVSFFEFAEQYRQSLVAGQKISMIKRVDSVLKKLKEYMNGSPLHVQDINVEFIVKYESYLLKLPNRINTVTANLKIIRRIMNDAIRQRLIKRDDDPFFSFRMKNETTHKEYLTEAELVAVEKLSLPKGSKLALTRDMYVFSAYTGGIRISDVLLLKWKNFDGERLHFNMMKTNRDVMVKLPNKTLKIIKKYQPKKAQPESLVFPFINSDVDLAKPLIIHNAISRSNALINKNLKTIATKAKIEKNISFHTSRHTFATLALRKGIRIEYVSKLLGHASIEETQIYAKIVNEELDKAMDVFNE